ncbi:hypothetical protein L1887_04299 [Cichorium endivia]|nr:hypothetical protein L1887_04299 [Cichorium endivia]
MYRRFWGFNFVSIDYHFIRKLPTPLPRRLIYKYTLLDKSQKDPPSKAMPGTYGNEESFKNGLLSKELIYISDHSALLLKAHPKIKVDAGVEVIVTQLFYDVDNFLKFMNDFRQIGITCPIVPGIIPINYNGFIRMTGFCKTRILSEITAALEPIKDNEEAVGNYGVLDYPLNKIISTTQNMNIH